MPEMNGLQATLAIRELDRRRGVHTTLVALTALATPAPAPLHRNSTPSARVEGGAERKAGRAMRILVVDDNYLCAWSVAAVLEQAGLEAEIASDAGAALELALARPFDAVVTDLTLPGLSGTDLVRALRERGFEGRILVMTGHDADALRPRMLESGADECLGKPVDMDFLQWLLRPAWTVDGEPLPDGGSLEVTGA